MHENQHIRSRIPSNCRPSAQSPLTTSDKKKVMQGSRRKGEKRKTLSRQASPNTSDAFSFPLDVTEKISIIKKKIFLLTIEWDMR